MTREEVLLIVRRHLAEEFELEPEAIEPGTRLREDLDADSLDLLALVQELEDSHGARIPEDEAAAVRTVDDAVDAVLRHLPARA